MGFLKRLPTILLGIIILNSVNIAGISVNKSDISVDEIAILQYNTPPSEGYTLFSPVYSPKTYLLDINNTVVHTWDSSFNPGQALYLLDNGNLLRTTHRGLHPIFITGGMGGGIQEFTWNGTLVWDYIYSGPTYLSHHDIEILPNGNILMIAWEYKTTEEAINAGRNPNLILQSGLWPDYIIEIKPTGQTTAEVIWEWHIWDHLIQDYDPTKENYGDVAEHPELININWIDPLSLILADWTHSNSIDYHEEFDQILLSVNGFSEIWVIDHSTTTEEAAGHTGGNGGTGGDLLYRWGNPLTYQQGTANDRYFYHQHDAQWIPPGLPGEGHILVFNNGRNRPGIDYSSIEELIPPVNNSGNYYLESGSSYGPEQSIWQYTADNPTDFYSSVMSGVQRLPNGNTLICSAENGIFFEVTEQKETVWDYINPYPSQSRNDVFKIRRYPPDFPGLSNLFLQPQTPKNPDGPQIGRIGKEYSFTTSSSDPQEHSLYYLFDWGDGNTTGWIGPYASKEEATASYSWNTRGNYDIVVKAKDINNNESIWSEPSTITIPENIFDLFILLLARIFNSILELFTM